MNEKKKKICIVCEIVLVSCLREQKKNVCSVSEHFNLSMCECFSRVCENVSVMFRYWESILVEYMSDKNNLPVVENA